MNYTDNDLEEAVKDGIFSLPDLVRFREYVKSRRGAHGTKFQKVLYYGGALLIISAMTWLMTESWVRFGPGGTAAVSAAYFVIFSGAGYYVFFRKNLETAGGLLFSVSIAVTPLLVFSVIRFLDFWPKSLDYGDYYIWIKGKWILLEISTIAVALPFFLKTKFTFHVFLISFTLWFLSMDIVPVLYETYSITWTERAHISIVFGLFMIFAAYFADIHFKKDYSFWLYLFGLLTFVSGLSIFSNNNLARLFLLGFVNVLLILFGVFIARNVFLVFGTLGLIQFLGRLSWEFFEDSVFFPFVLTGIGVLLILSGIFFQKKRKLIEEKIAAGLPESILNLRPKRNL